MGIGRLFRREQVTSGAAAIMRTLSTPAESALICAGYTPTNWLGFRYERAELAAPVKGLPRAWKEAHEAAIKRTALNRGIRVSLRVDNKPVPRLASHHYSTEQSVRMTRGMVIRHDAGAVYFD